jgi:hypothetical protein
MATTKHNIPLTAAELSNVWSGYQGDSLARCVLKHFLATVQDTEIKGLIEYALGLCEKHLARLKQYFVSENMPIPIGFTDEDVNEAAPRLYSDMFYLGYLMNMGKQGMALYSFALSVSSRKDIREYISECLSSSAAIYNEAVEIMQAKGVYVRPPHIPVQDTVEFVHKEGFFYGWFGDRRPVNSAEISHLYANIMTNHYGKSLVMGFSQVAKSAEIRDFMVRGRNIAQKHIEVFSAVLRDDNLPAPQSWDDAVMVSREAPFSDKLIMHHILGLNGAGVLNYGAAVAGSMRRDLIATYERLKVEISLFAGDGAEIVLKNGWFEKIPTAPERDALVT